MKTQRWNFKSFFLNKVWVIFFVFLFFVESFFLNKVCLFFVVVAESESLFASLRFIISCRQGLEYSDCIPYWGVTPHQKKKCPGYDIKLNLRVRSALSLPLLPGPLWPGECSTCYALINGSNRPILKVFVFNRTMLKKSVFEQLHKKYKYEDTINVIPLTFRHKITLGKLICHYNQSIYLTQKYKYGHTMNVCLYPLGIK